MGSAKTAHPCINTPPDPTRCAVPYAAGPLLARRRARTSGTYTSGMRVKSCLKRMALAASLL